MWPILIGSTVSFIAGILSLNPAKVLAIASFVYSAYSGYILARDWSFTRYDVTVFQVKECLHGQQMPYNTMYNISYAAYCGDVSAALSETYRYGNTDYYDNESIFRTAFRNIGIVY